MAIVLMVGEQARIEVENVFPGRGGQPIGLSAGQSKRTYTFSVDIGTVCSIAADPQSSSNPNCQVIKALAPGLTQVRATDYQNRVGAETVIVIPVVIGGARDQRPVFRLNKVESAQGV